ncbi:18593_t:CDS:2, partial [Racocetra fulgida]
DTWIVSRFYTNANTQYELDVNEENSQHNTTELDVNKENSQYDPAELDNEENLIDKCDIKQTKTLCVIHRNESVASSSLESYLRQKEANSYKKDELKLPKKRGPKNKRKSRLVLGESIHLQDTILNMPYKTVKIVEIIGENRVIVDVIFENSNTDRCIVQMADIIGYADEQAKKKSKAEFKTMDEKESINISENAFKIDKYASIETENVKLSISITDKGTYLENKDLPEEINFPLEDINIKQR